MKCDDAINERIIKIKEKTIKETSKYLKKCIEEHRDKPSNQQKKKQNSES